MTSTICRARFPDGTTGVISVPALVETGVVIRGFTGDTTILDVWSQNLCVDLDELGKAAKAVMRERMRAES